jgi:hypothetical protein
MIAGALGGCTEGGHDEVFVGSGSCALFSEVEPNATTLTAQLLGDVFVDDCVIVAGSVSSVSDVDSYGVLIEESLTLVVTLEHSPLVDFDILIFDADTEQLIRDCGAGAVPEICAVSFGVRSRAIDIDVVVISEVGAGTYTLTLDAQ